MSDERLNELSKLIKLGRASEDARRYLAAYIQRECEILWRKLITLQVENKSGDQLLAEFLDIRASAKAIDKLENDSLMREARGNQALEEFNKLTGLGNKSKRKKGTTLE